MPVKGGYLAMTGIGALFAYSGLKGKKFGEALRAVIAGKSPSTARQANPVTDSAVSQQQTQQAALSGSISSAEIASYKMLAVTLLFAHGWGGQFNSLNSIIMTESGWNSKARNSSGAFGIAQALGHGTANTAGRDGTNQYGNFGTSDAVCRAANNGNGGAQIQWMLNYIGISYGSPNAAWAYHQQNGVYLWLTQQR